MASGTSLQKDFIFWDKCVLLTNIFEGAIGGQKINVFSDATSSGIQGGLDLVNNFAGGNLFNSIEAAGGIANSFLNQGSQILNQTFTNANRP